MFKIFLTFLFVSCASASSEYIFRKDYKYHEEVSGWMKLHNIPANWQDARLRCLAEGASLASPSNSVMRNTMVTVMTEESANPSAGIYSGIHSTFYSGSYSTIEGVAVSVLPVSWAIGQPDNVYKEKCVVFHKNGTLENVQCTDAFRYICYKKFEVSIMTNCKTVDKEYTWDARTGHCYKFHQLGQTWSQAQMICTAEGGHLAVVNSNIEANVIKELFAKYPNNRIFSKRLDAVFLGFREWPDEYSWYTVHGQTLHNAGYAKWSTGEPNNGGGISNCGSIYRNGLLDDYSCHEPMAFICEIDPLAFQ